ncbi:Trehalose synthase/amylase TreS [Arthrobacter agilis]|nr:Trehalose synthase/amylase TreS [Arthrobacter agilis]
MQSLVYHYNHVNVEAQMATSSSLLHWVRQMLAVRKAHPAFGLGGYRNVPVESENVLAFLREVEEPNAEGEPAEAVLCIFNLSQHPVAARMRLPEFAGRGLRDLFGGAIFPAFAEDGEITLTLGSHDFFWLRVRSAYSNTSSPHTQSMPVIPVPEDSRS